MASIQDLPTELLHEIVDYLDDNTTASLQLSCREMNNAVASHRPTQYENLYESRSFRPFIRNLCLKPELAQRVTSIKIRCLRAKDLNHPKKRGVHTAVMKLMIETAKREDILRNKYGFTVSSLRKADIGDLDPHWVLSARNGGEAAQVKFILSRLRNLERLIIKELPFQISYDPLQLLSCLETAVALQHLEIEASPKGQNGEGGVVGRRFGIINLLPSLRTLRLSGFQVPGFSMSPQERFSTSGLIRVNFIRCLVSANEIACIGRASPALETFRYTMADMRGQRLSDAHLLHTYMALSQILEALLACKQSLKHLEIGVQEGAFNVHAGPPASKSHVEQLVRKFEVLETVTVPYHLCYTD